MSITSYSNPGGIGDRRSVITATAGPGISWVMGTPTSLIDGNMAHNVFWNNALTENVWLQFDFQEPVFIDEVTFRQDGATEYDQGIWQWSTSNDGWESKTTFGNDHINSSIAVMTGLGGNGRGYTSYRMTLVSGATNSGPWLTEIQFKIAPSSMLYRHIVQETNDLKVFANNIWQTVGQTPATFELFNSTGMIDLSAINDTSLSLLSDPVTLLTYAYVPESTPRYKKQAVPLPKLILPTGDIKLASIQCINQVTFSFSTSVHSTIKTIISTDSGVTWKSWNNGWANIDITNLENIKTNGISMTTMNARTKTEWDNLVGDSQTIRFGYYFEIDSSADIANTDSIVLNVDMKGRWRNAKEAEREYSYGSSATITVFLTASGDYKINY